MRLELGSRVDCTDESFGKLVDVVIDPTSRRVTHLVVERDRDSWLGRLVPVELAERGGDAGDAVALRATVEEVLRLPPVHEVAYLRLDGFPADDPDWDVGIEEVLALPYYPSYDVEPAPVDYAARYDRIPKGEVEIRRASAVDSADGHHLGQVDGFLVDDDQLITHVVLEQGHPWERREVLIPIGAVARVETDAVTLSLTKDEVGALPPVAVRRRPRPLEHRRPRREHDKEGALANATTRFFASLEARGHEPRLEKVRASLRFDLTNGKQTNRWHVAIDKGEIAVSHKNAKADCIVRADRSVFDGIASGEVNPVAAVLRGAIAIEGDPELLMLLRRLSPAPGRES